MEDKSLDQEVDLHRSHLEDNFAATQYTVRIVCARKVPDQHSTRIRTIAKMKIGLSTSPFHPYNLHQLERQRMLAQSYSKLKRRRQGGE